MSNLLNMFAAAAGTLVRKNSNAMQDPVIGSVVRPMIWLYRNCCYYGMQIQRYAHRYKRYTKRLVRPVVRAAVAAGERAKQPVVKAVQTAGSICADTKKAGVRINSVRKEAGAYAAVRQAEKSAVAGCTKYKLFLMSVVNYVLPVLCIILLFTVASHFFNRNYALAVECDGVVVGYIEDESTYTHAAELVGERVISSSAKFKSALTPTYSLVAVDESQLSSSDEICENILFHSDDVDQAYGLFINGKLLAAVKSEGDLNFILQEFLEKYRTGAAQETISFVGDTNIVPGLYATEMILPSADFKSAIGATEKVTSFYTISKNDTLGKILSRYEMTEERFMELNEGFDGTLKKGATVLVEKEQPVLAVQSVVVSSYDTTVAYTSTTETDPTKYTDYKKLKVAGANGVQRVTQQITYIDGVETNRVVIGRETLVEPVNEVYVVGGRIRTTTTTRKYNGGGGYTYVAPDAGVTDSSGSFAWPVPGVRTVSSPFGPRWGRMHTGIDISTGGIYGRTIVAAKSGTVTMVKRSAGGYGLHLQISHGDGYSTLYAHCSEILVYAGQTVSKGQAIAKVGNSGSSTGPHLHFEIRRNGKATNPMSYY